MLYPLLVLVLFSRDVLSSESLVPTTIRLQDTTTNRSFYTCTYGYFGPTSTAHIPPSIVIDARELQTESMNEAKNRIKYVKQHFPQALKITKVFSFLMLEDRTGVYELASTLNISIILAVTDDITNILRPDLYSLGIFFLPKNEFQSLFGQMKIDSLSGLLMDFSQPPPPGKGYGILAFAILKLLSLTSIITAGLIVIKNHEELLLLVHKNRLDSSTHPCMRAVIPALFVLCVISLILLSYFFFDIMVYFFIAIFVIAGASAMSFVISTFLLIKFPALKRLVFTIQKLDVNVLRCVLFFAFLAFTITWCVFRNDPMVGWIMQDIIGAFLIVHILADVSVFISFKTASLGFLILMIYDVFFVFISSYFFGSPSKPETQPMLTSSAEDVQSRGRRGISSPGTSIMEAVATGSAGSSGEVMPLVFKVSLAAISNCDFACHSNRDYVMLGFGDAVLPGVLCVFLAFYDACWKRKVPWNFICSLIGYLLGGLVVFTVLFSTKMAQPALLYLCPLTLGTTVLCAYLRGGITELRNLWTSNLPTPDLMLASNNGNIGGDGGVSSITYRLPDEGRLGSPSAAKKSAIAILPESTEPSVLTADGEKKSAYHQDLHLNI
ncbi:hypothetical protein Aperf_G00000075775 [Anoplocephala perfoliata]